VQVDNRVARFAPKSSVRIWLTLTRLRSTPCTGRKKSAQDALVCTVGKTVLRYDIRCLDDLHAMLRLKNMAIGWSSAVPGSVDEQKQLTCRPAPKASGYGMCLTLYTAGSLRVETCLFDGNDNWPMKFPIFVLQFIPTSNLSPQPPNTTSLSSSHIPTAASIVWFGIE
jgi:hypothetical protein